MSNDTALAIDLGGTRIKAGIVVGHKVVAQRVVPTEDELGADHVLRRLYTLGAELLAQYPAEAIGVCLPGVVDVERGTLVDVRKNLSGLIGYPIVEKFQQHFGLPVAVENDARLFGLGEVLAGAAYGVQNVVCLTLGTGVGCCVAIDGHILRGRHGTGGVLGGHMTLDVHGPRCTCGNIGCVETLCRAGRLLQAMRERLASGATFDGTVPVTPEEVLAAAVRGEPVAVETVAEYVRCLAAAVVSYIHLYDADLVVLGGGLMQTGHSMLPPLRQYVAEHVWTSPPRTIPVEVATLGDHAALIGAACLARGFDAFR